MGDFVIKGDTRSLDNGSVDVMHVRLERCAPHCASLLEGAGKYQRASSRILGCPTQSRTLPQTNMETHIAPF